MTDQVDGKPAEPLARKPETLWRLVNAQCSQLADAVSGARIALLVALTWSVTWAWALYTNDLGWINEQRDLIRVMYGLSIEEKSDEIKNLFKERCQPVLDLGKRVAPSKSPAAAAPSNAATDDLMLRVCRDATKSRFDWAEKAYYDQTLVAFPGGLGFSRISVADLGILGTLGLLLILSWCFFSFRRENHAIRAIVDMDNYSRNLARWFPREYTLEPQNHHLSCEHYAFAYHASAQRFLFMFSQHSRPLQFYAVVLLLVPFFVASWNIYTDIRDLARILPTRPEVLAARELVRLAFEGMFIVAIGLITRQLLRIQSDTSVILNGWYLASRDVWMEKWDERSQEPAMPVRVNVSTQKASP